ncbi:hypothetical protein PV10_07714 [Exophiala mesophila]|uniref:Carboxylic ester hydrolase n=1 Tax=Exophiala mesophila TaxID=212818 RepID=A0A0D1Z8N0_EXOME|nr:uncharacterized protein PV10_07714 [Exophiala mesophila]KIV90404.1 hypothetical protein PV10_07714 [Exophiala mesophila]
MARHIYTLGLIAALQGVVVGQGTLPQVDLGYEIHQAISLNETTQLYNFSNIRYAQAPVGELRFAAPVAPEGRNETPQNGSVGRICPQAYPAWGLIATEFTRAYVTGNLSSFNFTESEQELQALLASGVNSSEEEPDPRISEDCLFLDVIVPRTIFDNANNLRRKRQNAGAPVLVWIYGGGYVAGEKNSYGSPAGLINASRADGGDGIIYVAMNYRLGAFGFLAGPSLQAEGGVSNAGLYDQRLALEWVQDNIHLFGGDPNQVTIMGESAGGGSVEHQITAFGGERGVPFQKAIVQSPGFAPVTSQYTQENTTQEFLALLNVSTIAEARNLSSEAVIRANALQVLTASYSNLVYGPVVDGVFAPSLPGLALARGSFAENVSVMVGHNTLESPSFSPPFVQTNEELTDFLSEMYASAPPEVVETLVTEIYPAEYNGTQPYSSALERTLLIVQEGSFVCNNDYLNRGFDNQTYSYMFQVPPALHGQDVAYTFYDGQGSNLALGLLAPVAQVFQAILVNFAKNGDPNGPGVPNFPIYGENATMLAINVTYIEPRPDNTANPRCAWWQKSLLF